MELVFKPSTELHLQAAEYIRMYPLVPVPPKLPGNINVILQRQELWQHFFKNTTEMVITKQGRRMYPGVEFIIVGLEPRTYYCVILEIEPASPHRHKYVTNESPSSPGSKVKTGRWTTAGSAEPQPSIYRRVVVHPDSPATGDHWMREAVSFSKIKITNNTDDQQNNILLCSMHKYRVKVWIIPSSHTTSIDLFTHPSFQFAFSETEFIAVTAYQNKTIKEIKIDNNPFAKGFRQNGKRRSGEHLNREDDGSDDEEIKRPTKDDSGISSNGTSPPPVMQEEENPVKLHRPWLDSSSPSPTSPSSPPCLPPKPQISSTSTTVMPPPNPFIPIYENVYIPPMLVHSNVQAFPSSYPTGYMHPYPWYS